MALVDPEKSTNVPPMLIRKEYLTVRCEHWREAFNKARNHARNLESPDSVKFQDGAETKLLEGRWMFLGITGLCPIMSKMEDLETVGSYVYHPFKPLSHFSDECLQDYSLEKSFDEEREGTWYKSLKNEFNPGY